MAANGGKGPQLLLAKYLLTRRGRPGRLDPAPIKFGIVDADGTGGAAAGPGTERPFRWRPTGSTISTSGANVLGTSHDNVRRALMRLLGAADDADLQGETRRSVGLETQSIIAGSAWREVGEPLRRAIAADAGRDGPIARVRPRRRRLR